MRIRDQGPATTLDRRALIGGLAACLAAPEVAAQTEPGAEGLSVNILTRMAANVRIDGRRAVFVLDTGAERTSIAADLARSLALAPGPGMVVHGVTAARFVPSAIIPRLSFGGRSFGGVVAPVFERASLAADGLIRLDVLSRFRLELDLVRRRVLVHSSGEGQTTIAPATRLVISDRVRAGRFGQLILLDVLVQGRIVEAFVDSGAQYSIGNPALLSAVDRSTEAGSIDVFGVTGQTLRARLGRIDELIIDGQGLGSTPLLFADLHAFEALGLKDRPAMLLGADILYRFQRVTLDYGRRRVAFGRVRPAFAPPPPRN